VRFSGVIFVLGTAFFLASCSNHDTAIDANGNAPIISPIPKTPPVIAYPADNRPLDVQAEIELGRHLFYDKQMSVDGSTSCASCHQVQNGFADVLEFSTGFQNQHGMRNAPGLTNVAYNTSFAWDGKFSSLEKHALAPMFNSVEMGNNFSTGKDAARDTLSGTYNSKPGNNDTLLLFGRLDGFPGIRSAIAEPCSPRKDLQNNTYYMLIKKAWGPVTIPATTDGGQTKTTMTTIAYTMDIIARSIAAFERTIISNSSSFDRYNSGDQAAMSPPAIHGFQLFIDPSKANCVSCHSGYNFTDQQFHNNGTVLTSHIDIGRAGLTKQDSDRYTFKTPSLRNVSLTRPYMHDGHIGVNASDARVALTAVINNYNAGGNHSKNQDARIRPLYLSDQDVSDIVEFLMQLQNGGFGSNTSLSNPWGN
jgi:cytochrome c peroxidase